MFYLKYYLAFEILTVTLKWGFFLLVHVPKRNFIIAVMVFPLDSLPFGPVYMPKYFWHSKHL